MNSEKIPEADLPTSPSAANVMDNAEIVPASRAGKLLAALLMLFTIGLLAGFWFYLLPLLRTVLSGTASLAELIRLKSLFILLACLALSAGLLMMRSARQIARSGRYPPGDKWHWQAMRIKRGDAARRMARLQMIAGAITVLLAIGLALYIWIALERIAPLPPLRPGVTFLKEKSSL